uniref:Uncharacterized protein n=1 Tax=Arundo donax TaxID=35708 RepID=A0A0A8Y2S9_ARUDO
MMDRHVSHPVTYPSTCRVPSLVLVCV